MERHKKLGVTFGRYDGITPVISTIDPELVKSITVKNFDSFHGTFDIDLPDKHLTLDISSGVKWKELRKALSPTFSSGQLKSMLAPMSDVANVLMEFLDKELSKSKGVVNLRKCFEGLALDTISRCAFGIDTDANNNTDQDILRWGKESFASVRVDGWIVAGFFRLFFLFPSLARYLPLIPPAIDRLREMTGPLMKQHKVQETKNTNFVARLSDILDNPNSPAILTEDLVTAQGVIFFIAGFETTANSLSTLCYNLSQNPEVQETLYQEIQEVLREHGGKITHDTINHMKYLEACIMENLRIMGPVTIHSRVCSKDCEVKPGFLIKKGTRVDLNIHASHHWSDYFHNPEKFQPERFLKENEQEIIPYTYRPFGAGNRLCIGQRFAIIEMKITMAKILSAYRIVATEETKLDFFKGDLMLLSYPEMKVCLEKR